MTEDAGVPESTAATTTIRRGSSAVPWVCGSAVVAEPARPLRLERGGELRPAEVAYETFGRLAADGSNAVLICHALTGDAHVARAGADDRPGWWEALVGEGRAIDPARHFVVCTNVLGGCSGSTGPTSMNPETGRLWRGAFPHVTIGDMVAAQARVLEHLGLGREKLTVVGGSIGGFQALEWAARFPDRVKSVAVLACGAALNAFGLAFNAVGRNAVIGDAKFAGGEYEIGDGPVAGLAVARQLAHLTYRASPSYDRRFGRRSGSPGRFAVHDYLVHKGGSFVKRFDANSYLRMLDAMDEFYLAAARGSVASALSKTAAAFLFVGYSSDWLFPAVDVEALAVA
ncbi:MAG: homoserine O-acetyltransferase, partial [Planctomycetota bacterium]